jgi:hypothetical protein
MGDSTLRTAIANKVLLRVLLSAGEGTYSLPSTHS